jgi:GT2 family glycosyltransferase
VTRPEASVSVAFANYNGRELLEEFLDSLRAQDYPISDIIMVDDGSTDESLDFVRNHYPEVTVISMGYNSGNVNNVWNRGIQAASSRYVLSMDNDMTLAPDALGRLVEGILTLPDAVIATPRVLDYDNPEVISQEAHRVHFVGFGVQGDRDKHISEAVQKPDRWRVGCGQQLLDTEVIAPYGFYDEGLAFGINDMELPWRMNLAGLASYQIPDAHFFNRQVRKRPRYLGQVLNRWIFILQLFAVRTFILTLPALLCFELLLAVYICLKGGWDVYPRALGRLVKQAPTIWARRREIQATRKVSDRELLCAEELLIPLSINAGPILRLGVRAVNSCLRLYWSMVRLLL